jgi:hypothetical protein
MAFNNRTQLDVRFLQNSLDTLHVLHDLARQLPARPGQIAHFLNRRRSASHIASFTSLLRPGHVLHMRGIRQNERKTPFQNVPNRLPIYARCFHRHVRASRTLQPFGKRQ